MDDFPSVALGCGSFGGIGSAPQFFGQGESEEEACAIMDAAWQLGLRWFDTGDAYGGGRSETWIGRWIRATGKRPLITTKTYYPIAEGADGGLAPERIRRQIETSLERLGIDCVDFYLAHRFDPDTPLEDTFEAFEELVGRGRIRAFGVSDFTPSEVRDALRVGRPALLQNSYSLLDRGNEREIIPLCAEHGVAYQVFSPLAGGWLTGKYRRGEPPPPGSRMTKRPEGYLHYDDERVYRGLDALGEAAAARGVSMAGVALAWVLSHPAVTSIVVGPRRPEHLEPVREALGLHLSPEERDEVSSLFS